MIENASWTGWPVFIMAAGILFIYFFRGALKKGEQIQEQRVAKMQAAGDERLKSVQERAERSIALQEEANKLLQEILTELRSSSSR
jgi:hypothetical protein